MPADGSYLTPSDQRELGAMLQWWRAGLGSFERPHARRWPKRPGTVRVKNTTGSSRQAYEVLGINGAVFETTGEPDSTSPNEPSDATLDFQEKAHFHGKAISTATTFWSLPAILQADCAVGETVAAKIDGLTVAKVQVTSTLHQYACVSSTKPKYLKSSYGGSATILAKKSGTGPRWAYVRLGADQTTRCTGQIATTTAITTGTTSFEVDRIKPLVGRSPVTSSTQRITVANAHHWNADKDALCRFEWSRINERFEAYQVTCPSTEGSA